MTVHTRHYNNTDNKPVGGFAHGPGFAIVWQDGPLPQNGAFITDVLVAVKDRLEYHQAGPFKCKENDIAIGAIDIALTVLNSRIERMIKGMVDANQVTNDLVNDLGKTFAQVNEQEEVAKQILEYLDKLKGDKNDAL